MVYHTRSIDPEVIVARELAEHGNEIRHIQEDMDKVIRDMDEIKIALRKISETLSEAKGGWKMLMLVGGCGAALGTFVSQLIDFLRH